MRTDIHPVFAIKSGQVATEAVGFIDWLSLILDSIRQDPRFDQISASC